MKRGRDFFIYIGLAVIIVLEIILLVEVSQNNLTGEAILNKASTQSSLISGSSGDSSCEQVYLHYDWNRLYIGDKINKAKSIITHVDLPKLLADGNIALPIPINYGQFLYVGNATINNGTYQNGSYIDPSGVYIKVGTASSKPLYKYQIVFDKVTNFQSLIGSQFNILNQGYSVAPGTNAANLYLLRSPQQFYLSIGSIYPPSELVSVENKFYTVELIGATDFSATVKVTSSDGVSNTKQISEGTSKEINNLEVAVDDASESVVNNTESARLSVGAEILKLTPGNEIKQGSDEVVIDGAFVPALSGNTTWNNVYAFNIIFFASDSDNDEIPVGAVKTNPVFNTLDFVFESYDLTNGALIKFRGCVKCSDGTIYGSCSGPLYCNGVDLVSVCGKCNVGCASGYNCLGGKCCKKINGQWKCLENQENRNILGK